jgi:hypothetical protein
MSAAPAKRRRRRIVALAVVVLVLQVVAAFLLLRSYRLRETDQHEVARVLVAWIVEDERLPGFGEHYPDAQHMPGQIRFFVICDFLPEDESISSDPKVRRIAESEYKAIFKQYGYGNTDYLAIELKEVTEDSCTFELSNMFSRSAGHDYQFVVSRKLWGLRFSGKLLRVY